MDPGAGAEVESPPDVGTRRRGGQRQARRADPQHLVGMHPGGGSARVVRDQHLDAAVDDRLQPDGSGDAVAVRDQPALRHSGAPGGLEIDVRAEHEQPGEHLECGAAVGAAEQRREFVPVQVCAGGGSQQPVERGSRPAGGLQRGPDQRSLGEQGRRVGQRHGHRKDARRRWGVLPQEDAPSGTSGDPSRRD
ncbi:MAG: hypothetical protein WD794_06355 [Mycobacteriales bacterium]